MFHIQDENSWIWNTWTNSLVYICLRMETLLPPFFFSTPSWDPFQISGIAAASKSWLKAAVSRLPSETVNAAPFEESLQLLKTVAVTWRSTKVRCDEISICTHARGRARALLFRQIPLARLLHLFPSPPSVFCSHQNVSDPRSSCRVSPYSRYKGALCWMNCFLF